MSLIEQLDGYESAKNVRDFRREKNILQSYDAELSAALLAYRRTNGIYEVGDWVFTNNEDFSEEPCQLIEDMGYDFRYETKSSHWGFIVKSFLPKAWRHATDEEIAAGQRL